MIEVEVLIPNFRDKEIKNSILMQPGDKYKISKERYEYLSRLGIVKRTTKIKDNQGSE